MKHLLWTLLLAPLACFAQTTINNLPVGSALAGPEPIPMWQVNPTPPCTTLLQCTYYTTPTAISTYTWNHPPGGLAQLGRLTVNTGITNVWLGSGILGALNTGIYSLGYYTGNCTGYCFANQNYIGNWAVNSNGQQAGNTWIFSQIGGPGQVGGFINFDSTANVTATTGNMAGSFYQSGQFNITASANDSGTALALNGSLSSLGVSCALLSGATYWEGCGGIEVDIAAATGTIAYNTVDGVAVVLSSNNAVAGTLGNDAFIVSAQSGAVPTLSCAYCLGGYNGFNAMAAVADVMAFEPHGGSGAGPTIANIFDFAGLRSGTATPTITGYVLASPGFRLDGSGNTTAESFNGTSGDLVITSATTGNVYISSATYGIFGEFTNTAGGSNVDYPQFVSVGGGNSEVIANTAGADTNVSWQYRCKGASCRWSFNPTGGADLVQMFQTTSAVNGVSFTGEASGTSPIIAAQGADTNINLSLSGKGTGSVVAAGAIGTAGYLISGLPTCNGGNEGLSAYVTNGATSPTYLSTVSATGSTVAPVFCNGSNWVYH